MTCHAGTVSPFPQSDRRKAADSLKALLNGNSSAVDALDSCGTSGPNDVASKFTWNNVFGSTHGFVKDEVDGIAKLADKVLRWNNSVALARESGRYFLDFVSQIYIQ